jgi:hypothetical protein
MLTGYPLHMQLPGRPGLGGYWGVSSFSVPCIIFFLLIDPGMGSEGLVCCMLCFPVHWLCIPYHVSYSVRMSYLQAMLYAVLYAIDMTCYFTRLCLGGSWLTEWNWMHPERHSGCG